MVAHNMWTAGFGCPGRPRYNEIKKVHLLIVRITALVGSPRWNVKSSAVFELLS